MIRFKVFLYFRPHRMLNNLTPNEAELSENESKVLLAHEKYYAKHKKKKPKYSIGEKVRISTSKGKFTRSYKPLFKDEVYEIVGVKQNLPVPLYSLQSLSDKSPLKGFFYENEFSLINY